VDVGACNIGDGDGDGDGDGAGDDSGGGCKLLINKWRMWKSKNMDKTIFFFYFYFLINLFDTCLLTESL